MKLNLLFLSLLFQSLLLSQNNISGLVTDLEGEPLPFVNITANAGKTGTTTNLDGRFKLELNEPFRQLKFSYIGFETQTLSGNSLKEKITVQLKPSLETLAEVTILPGVNPAHRIIKNVVANADLNNPENLESFKYKTYTKFWVTFNLDSIDPSIDTVMLSKDTVQLAASDSTKVEPDSIVKIDSSGFKMHERFSNQHLFFMETVTERKFRSALRDNETVLAQRTSGFKNPMFALLVTQLQSFSFYNNYVGITGNEYLNPISKGSTSRYYFIIEDTLFKAPGDTTYIISFRPRPNKGFNALKGVLSINTTDWAIENVRAQPASTETFPVIIKQSYQRYGEHTWFPTAFEADIDLNMIKVNRSVPQAVMRRKLLDIELNLPLKRKDVAMAELTVNDDASRKADAFLKKYRTDSLSNLETDTYTFMDSVSEEENFERNLNLLLTLSRGYVPLGPVNLDLGKIINYNTYEGFRLGLGLTSNEKLSDWFTLSGYYAYGFKDERNKYGAKARIDLIKNLNFALEGGTNFDLVETGGFDIPEKPTNSLTQDNYRQLLIEQWDYTYRQFAALQIDPLPWVSYELRGRLSRRQTVGNYRFTPSDAQPNFTPARENQFTEIINTLRIAPQEEFAETPFGKITLSGGYPVFWLSYTKGLAGALDGDFNFDKIQLLAEYRKKTLRLGTTVLHFRSGHVFQDVPAQKLFVGTTNMISSNNFWDRTEGVADRNSFETMRFNEFLSSTYLELMWRQDFKTLFFKGKRFRPHFELVNRFAIGTLGNASNHSGVPFKTLEHGFFETGIEANRLYTSAFLGFGIGFYYRYGANSLPNFEDNFALKLTSKFSL
jgi:hypothetical protein